MRREFRVELVQSERDIDFTAFARLIASKIMTGAGQGGKQNNHLRSGANGKKQIY